MAYTEIVQDQTKRSIWSLGNVIRCIPEEYWNKPYCEMPLWKHVYHTIHSLDRWYINPYEYAEPGFHVENLNNLDVAAEKQLSRAELLDYFATVENKITAYIAGLPDEALLQRPQNCAYTKFQLILAQHRHLDMHIGMLMGFLIADTGQWPYVMGLETVLSGEHPLFF